MCGLLLAAAFLLGYALFGLQPAGWHLQSIFWHGLNALLLLLQLRPWIALTAVTLFLVYPLHVEAVAVSPKSTTALTNLAVVHLQRGELAFAQPLLEQAAAHLNSPLPWYHLLFE